jgi:hypothetical protein
MPHRLIQLMLIWPAVLLAASAYDARIEIIHPLDGHIVLPNLDVSCDLWVDDPPTFSAAHSTSGKLCLSVGSGTPITMGAPICSHIGTASLPLRGLMLGQHTLEAWLMDASGSQITQRHAIGFTVAAKVAALVREDDLDGPDLLQWYQQRERTEIPKASVPSYMRWRRPPPNEQLLLVIGIKSSTSREGFQSRQSLRETWMKDLPQDMRAWFILGKVADGTPQQVELTRALQAEQEEYGDLLLGEVVGVEDSYYTLVPKVKAFLKFAAECNMHGSSGSSSTSTSSTSTSSGSGSSSSGSTSTGSSSSGSAEESMRDPSLCFHYAMLMDDDVLLRIHLLRPALLGLMEDAGANNDSSGAAAGGRRQSKRRLYAGQVWSEQYYKPIEPQRDPSKKNYVSTEVYPFSTLPPFAIGTEEYIHALMHSYHRY